MRRAAVLGILVLPGCISLTLARKPSPDDSIEVSPAGEDGTRYVAVRAGRRTRPEALERRWGKAATEACEGDYVHISDMQSEQKTAGFVSARTHEGFVRCVLPDNDQVQPSESAAAPTRAGPARRAATPTRAGR